MAADWQDAWLSRRVPALRNYTNIMSLALYFAMLMCGVIAFFGIRHTAKMLQHELNNRAKVLADMRARTLKISKAQFWIAATCMVHVTLLMIGDAAIGFLALRDEAAKTSWTVELATKLAVYCLYTVLSLGAAMIVAPLLQLLLATSYLNRYARKHGPNALSKCISQARLFSTQISQSWAAIAWCISAYWPGDEYTVWRAILLQASFGSAIAWLDASYAFTFHADKLIDQDFACHPEIKKLVVCFAERVKIVHWREKGDVLPLYEVVASGEQTPLAEKEG